jgi:hypothetical protein
MLAVLCLLCLLRLLDRATRGGLLLERAEVGGQQRRGRAHRG